MVMIVVSGIRPRFKLQLCYFLGDTDCAKITLFLNLFSSVKWRMIIDSIFRPWSCRCQLHLISLKMKKCLQTLPDVSGHWGRGYIIFTPDWESLLFSLGEIAVRVNLMCMGRTSRTCLWETIISQHYVIHSSNCFGILSYFA